MELPPGACMWGLYTGDDWAEPIQLGRNLVELNPHNLEHNFTKQDKPCTQT